MQDGGVVLRGRARWPRRRSTGQAPLAAQLGRPPCGTGGRGWPAPGRRAGRRRPAASASRASSVGVVGHPLQRGVGEDDVDGLGRVAVLELAPLEAHARRSRPVVPASARRPGPGRASARRRRCRPSRPPASAPVQLDGQLARSAPEVDGACRRARGRAGPPGRRRGGAARPRSAGTGRGPTRESACHDPTDRNTTYNTSCSASRRPAGGRVQPVRTTTCTLRVCQPVAPLGSGSAWALVWVAPVVSVARTRSVWVPVVAVPRHHPLAPRVLGHHLAQLGRRPGAVVDLHLDLG